MVSVRLLDRNVLFIHVPKTAGGSISRLLRDEPDAVIHPVQSMRAAVPCVEQLQKQLDSPLSEFRTVSCVRNPWDWSVSGWLHVTANMPAYDDPPGFRDFILGDWMGANTAQYPDKFADASTYVAYHTQISQWEHLCLEGEFVEPDTICRYEHLEADFAKAFDIDAPLPHVNKSDRVDYRKYYEDDTRKQVERRNQPLIERFGYTF